MRSIPVKDKSLEAPFFRIAPFRKELRRNSAHKHNNYFEIIYLSKGAGYHSIDQRKYEVKPPVIFFIRKEQVHSIQLNEHPAPEGYVLIIKKTFFDRSVDAELKKLVARISTVSCRYLPEVPTVDRLFELILTENDTDSDGSFSNSDSSFPITESLLKALLTKVLEVASSNDMYVPFRPGTYEAFLELLSSGIADRHKVADYAEALNTSPQNLSAICRKSAGVSAAEVIADFVLSEAKRLLIYTDKTISEIAFQLGFKDPSHFVKYFKRHALTTPLRFRNSES